MNYYLENNQTTAPWEFLAADASLQDYMPKINLSIVLCRVFSWVIAINVKHIDACIPLQEGCICLAMWYLMNTLFPSKIRVHYFHPLTLVETTAKKKKKKDIIGDITTLNEWISGINEQKVLGLSPSFQFDACSSSVKASHEAMSDFAIDPCLTNTSSPLSAGAHSPTPADPNPSALGSQEATGSAPVLSAHVQGPHSTATSPTMGIFSPQALSPDQGVFNPRADPPGLDIPISRLPTLNILPNACPNMLV